jgi:hypothetical protein
MAPHSFSALCLVAVLGLGAPGAAQTPGYTVHREDKDPGEALLVAPPAAATAQQPPPQISTLWDGALVDSENGTPFGESDGYRKLLQTLETMSAEEAASHAAVRLDYKLAMQDPGRLRGEWVKVRGLLVQVDAERLDRPLGGAVDVWRGWLADTDGSEPVAFDMLQRPTGIELQKDLVDVEGIFYRTVKYETKKDAAKEVPYILAQRVARVDEAALPRHGVADVWALVLIGLAVAFIVMRVVQIARQQKRGDTRHLRDHGEAIRRAAAIPHHRPPAPSGPASSTPTTPTPPDSP